MGSLSHGVATFTHRDPGTSEAVWRDLLDDTPIVHFADLLGRERVVVVAPHPDDESLGAGATIASLSAAGARAEVVLCTDGEAAAPGRPAEACRAAERLSTGTAVRVHRLALPDGGLDHDRAELERRLADVLAGAELVIAPWPGDGHPDHAAVGHAVRTAVREVALDAVLLEYPIWAWHWGEPSVLPAADLVRVPVTPSARRAKAEAISCHRSQQEGPDPILTPDVLAHFDRNVEAFVVAEEHRRRITPVDRSSPAFFEALYRSTPSHDPWDLDRNDADVAKAAAVCDLVGVRPEDRVLEVGCGPGVLTVLLAERVGHVLAVDASATAVSAARERCEGRHDVEVRAAVMPGGLRDDDPPFDTVVLADIGYYGDRPSLEALVAEVAARTRPGAQLVAAHWRGQSPDHRLSAHEVHRAIDDVLGWRHADSLSLRSHLVDRWTRP